MLNDGNTMMVYAHCDDELLWSQPLLAGVHSILWAGPAIGTTREHRMPQIYQGLPVGQLYPSVTDQQWISEANNQCYRDLETYNLEKTKALLRPLLCKARRRHGVRRVVTHNPWGEYGHPNHRTLCQAVREVCAAIGIDAWANDIVHTHLGNNLESNPPGEYLTAYFLDAEYEGGHQFDEPNFLDKRAMFQDTYMYYTNNRWVDLASVAWLDFSLPWVPVYPDIWTWHDADNEYPAGPRSYWCMVKDGVDLIATNATLLDQVNKIAGITPYPQGDPHIEYYSPLYYYCASSGDVPIFGVP